MTFCSQQELINPSKELPTALPFSEDVLSFFTAGGFSAKCRQIDFILQLSEFSVLTQIGFSSYILPEMSISEERFSIAFFISSERFFLKLDLGSCSTNCKSLRFLSRNEASQ